MSESRTIVLDGIGPNSKPVVVPIQPGMTILTGYCGTGKTVTLAAIAVALGSNEKSLVKPTEGLHGGKVDCCGVVLSVSANRVTRTGDADVGSLEEFDVGSLIDPPVKNADSRNAHGIKSLLRMTKAEADPALFHHLAGDKAAFDSLVGPDAQKSADLVEMAGKVKRAFEKKCREINQQAETEEAAAMADRDAMKGIDAAAETDPKKLQQAHTEAVQLHATLKTQWDAYWDAQEAAEAARAKLTDATGGARSIEECENIEAEKKDAYEKSSARVKEIEDELRVAKAEKLAAFDSMESAKEQTAAARKTAAATAGWQAAINNAAGGIMPDESRMTAAEESVSVAQKRIEQAAVIRAAKERAANAKKHQEAADKLRKDAHRMDLAAKGTDAVLSKAVASERFRVIAEVLIGKLPDGVEKPYYSFSDGERTLITGEEKIDRVRAAIPSDQMGIIDLPQRVAQDLPKSLLNRLAARAAEKNVCIVTGLVDEGPLRAIVWTPDLWPASNGKPKKDLIAATEDAT